jgi:undecaprenyl diphosphate synthase
VSPGASAAEETPASGSDREGGGPEHVAIIMDGNGRWATQRGLPRVAGHRAGAEALRKAIRGCVEHGVKALTVYAFSSENWRRGEEEVSDLTTLMRYYLERELATFEKEGVRLKIIGDFTAFGADLASRLERAIQRTAHNNRITLVVALNYGSHVEIAAAARRLAERVASGEMQTQAIDAGALASELQTSDLPPLDLLVRTSGEVRLSNFLLWQAAYAELVFLDVLWPDFDEAAVAQAVGEFRRRQRRFGGR